LVAVVRVVMIVILGCNKFKRRIVSTTKLLSSAGSDRVEDNWQNDDASLEDPSDPHSQACPY
jgi:hypothetical protein